MLKSVMNVLMVPVLGFALLIAVSHAEVIVDDEFVILGDCEAHPSLPKCRHQGDQCPNPDWPSSPYPAFGICSWEICPDCGNGHCFCVHLPPVPL